MKHPDKDWDGEWWSESLEGTERERFEHLVSRLSSAAPDKYAVIAREIFQFGHEHGYELAIELSRD